MGKKEIENALHGAVEAAKGNASGGDWRSEKAQRKKAKRPFPFKVNEDGVWRRVERENEDGKNVSPKQILMDSLRVVLLASF